MSVKTVLVADDHPDLLELLQFLLETHGYRVVTAGDGFEAVAAVERHMPDAVVMDLWMPRLDGVSATKLIRVNHESLPIIAHTAHPATLGLNAALFTHVCVKPCPSDTLLKLIGTLTG